jgi:hypothetical protein
VLSSRSPRRQVDSRGSRPCQLECDDIRIEFEACQRLDAEAEKELHMQERLYMYEAKQKGIDNSQAGKRHGSPFGARAHLQGGSGALWG